MLQSIVMGLLAYQLGWGLVRLFGKNAWDTNQRISPALLWVILIRQFVLSHLARHLIWPGDPVRLATDHVWHTIQLIPPVRLGKEPTSDGTTTALKPEIYGVFIKQLSSGPSLN